MQFFLVAGEFQITGGNVDVLFPRHQKLLSISFMSLLLTFRLISLGSLTFFLILINLVQAQFTHCPVPTVVWRGWSMSVHWRGAECDTHRPAWDRCQALCQPNQVRMVLTMSLATESLQPLLF